MYTNVKLPVLALRPEDTNNEALDAHGIDLRWTRNLVNRLIFELNRELGHLEASKPEASASREDAMIRGANARTLDTLLRSFERMTRMASASAARQHQTDISDEEARSILEPQILEIVARIEKRYRERIAGKASPLQSPVEKPGPS